MFGTAYFGATHYGPAYFPPGNIIIEDVSPGLGAGGNYGGRILPSIADYEKRIKKLLERERAERLNEAKKLRKRLIQVQAQQLLAEQQDKIRQKQEIELKYLLVSESLLRVEEDLAEIKRKQAQIELRAKIMRDDDEVIILLYG